MKRSLNPAVQLRESLLPYSGALSADDALRLAEAAGGLILSGVRGLSTARRLRTSGFEGLLFVDPALYAPRPSADVDGGPPEGLFTSNADWLSQQEDAGVSVLLSPSQAVPIGATDELSKVVEAGNTAASRASLPLVTVIALPSGWLRAPHIETLVGKLSGCETPVAFALGHRNDPLGTESDIAGLLRALQVTTGGGLIRSDVAVLGAIAHGAPFGAIGLGSTQRHFVPQPARPGGNRADRSVRLFVPRLLTFRTANLLASVAGRDPEGILRCYCVVCEGRSLERFEDDRLRPEARLHDVLALRDVADKLLSRKQSLRRGTWRQMCHEAIEAHTFLEQASNVSFPVPSHLKAWERFSSSSS